MGKLYEQVYEWDNLVAAYDQVAKGKKHKREWILYDQKKEDELFNIHNHLVNHSYVPGGTITFWVRDPKTRKITRPYLTDRIIHTAVDNIVRPYIESYLINATFACRKGKGVLACAQAYQEEIRSAIGEWGTDFYVLSFDMKKYFQTMYHPLLEEIYRRAVPDEDLVELMIAILGSYYEGVWYGTKRGCPIGFLPSQNNGNLNGSIPDHLFKDILGIKHYVRYMDDGRLLLQMREDAMNVLYALDLLATVCMKQKLNVDKTKIEHFHGYDTLVGYKVYPHHLEAKPATVRRADRRILKKRRMYEEGELSAQELYDTCQSQIAYLDNTTTEPTSVVIENLNYSKAILDANKKAAKQESRHNLL